MTSDAAPSFRAVVRRARIVPVLIAAVGLQTASAAQPPKPQPPAADHPAPGAAVAAPGAASRSRMLECGHQWSNMKHAGTASGTWKDFSRGCLAQK